MKLTEQRQRAVIGWLMLIQLAVLWLSFSWLQISPFCTVAKSPDWRWIGYVHILFIPVFLLGVVSFEWRKGRGWYVALLLTGLTILCLQALLVENGILTCDLP